MGTEVVFHGAHMTYRNYDPILELAAIRSPNLHHGVNPALEDSITFAHDPVDIAAGFRGQRGEDFHIYGRFSHPSLHFLARQFMAIEDAGSALLFASGQAATAAVFHTLCQDGDHVVVSSRLYGGTVSFLDTLLEYRNIRVTRVDITNLADVKRALKKKRTTLLFAESVSNPSIVACDIAALATLAHEAGALMAVDNTFMPLAVLPIRLGADIVMHSLTKFGSGQSDLLAGILCFGHAFADDKEKMGRFRSYLSLHGAVMFHGSAHKISKRLPHLRIRFREASHAAQSVAEGLSKKGMQVYHPSLALYAQSDAISAILRTTELGYGSVIAADLGTPEEAMEFARRFEAQHGGYSAVSLGSAHTYLCAPLASVHCAQNDKVAKGLINYRAPPELTPGLVRIACGYELPPEMLWEKIEAALPF